VLKWSYELYGRSGALLSLSLYVFDPNLLAHGQLVTADLPAALMTTMALYHFWHFLKLGGKRRALFSEVTLGLSQLAKYSCVYLYPIFLAIAAIYCRFRPATEGAKPDQSHSLTWILRHWFIVITFFAAVSIVTINLGFCFAGIGTPLSGYSLKDPFFKKLQATRDASWVPGVLLLCGLLQGTDREANHIFAGIGRILFKAWLAGGARTSSRGDFSAGSGLLDLLQLLFKAQIGIRHVLPVFALATIFCGRLVSNGIYPPSSWSYRRSS
jgi:hypothetical protein